MVSARSTRCTRANRAKLRVRSIECIGDIDTSGHGNRSGRTRYSSPASPPNQASGALVYHCWIESSGCSPSQPRSSASRIDPRDDRCRRTAGRSAKSLASPFPNGLPGLVECIGPIGTTWLRLDAVSVAAPPQHSRRCAFVGPPSSRLRSPAIWYQFNQYTPLVAEVGARSTGGAHPCRCSEIRTWRVHCDRDWPQTVIEKFLDRHPHCCLIRTKKGIHQCKEPSCIWQHLFWWSS